MKLKLILFFGFGLLLAGGCSTDRVVEDLATRNANLNVESRQLNMRLSDVRQELAAVQSAVVDLHRTNQHLVETNAALDAANVKLAERLDSVIKAKGFSNRKP